MKKMIEVTGVSKSFGRGGAETKVLNHVSLDVKEGEFVSLMGASGSGKSTLLYLIGGLDRSFEGSIKVCGEDIGRMKEREISRLRLERIGFIFQFYNLVQNLNVEDNILLPGMAKGKTRAEMKDSLDEILEITGLADRRKAMPNELSGGQQQRTAIARAVISAPQIILADEATGNLDSVAGGEVMDLFAKINREKHITILQVTHSEVCAACGTRIVRLVNGRALPVSG